MANLYNLYEWISGFEKDNGVFDFEKDALLSNEKSLLPGRFYILEYKAETDKPYNTRPVIISLGLSKKEPNSFLCIDLAFIPKKIRIRFVQTIFNMFEKQIIDNMKRYWDVKDADKQKQIISFSYELLDKMQSFKPFKNAVKRYKIKNTYKIYSLPYSKVYKVLGDFADQDTFSNTTIAKEQQKFIEDSRK